MSEEMVSDPAESTPSGDAVNSLIGSQEAEPVELGEGEYFLAENIKGSGDKPDWYLGDKYKSVADQAKAYTELQKKFGGFTGAPQDGYKAPEGVDPEDDAYKAFSEFAAKNNMNQELFNEGFEFYKTALGVSEEVSAESELAKLGDNAEQRIGQIETFLKNNVKDASDYEEIQNMATDAKSIMLIEKMMQVLAPKKLPIDGGEHPEGLTMEKIMELSMKKNENGQYLRSVDPAFNAKIEKMMQSMG